MASNEIEIIVEVDDRASAKLDAIADAADRIGVRIESSMQKFMDMTSNATQHAADRFKAFGNDTNSVMRSFSESVDKATKDVKSSFKDIGSGTNKQLTNGLNEAARAASNVGQSVAMAGMQMAGAAVSGATLAASGTVASGGMNILAGAALAAASAAAVLMSAMFALAPALSLVGGLAGAAITGLAGAGIAAATLGVGLGGVSDAWNAYGKSAGGGGGASKAAGEQAYQAARRIEQAENALTRAKESARAASLAVNEAREAERERIEDLTLALRGQKFAQQDADKALKEAEEKLAREKVYGNSNSQDAAQAEVDRAKYQYDYETERLKDLEKDKREADKNGIDGSKQVQDALKRERDAADAVTEAMKSLADAKRKVATASGGAGGGINAFADAMSKLSPNAQKFVRTLIDLRERFAAVKREVQDRLFAGLDETLRNLADAWGPKLVPILGGMADAFNRMAKAIGAGLADPTFIANIERIGESFEVFIDYLGEAITHLLDAFGRIGAAAGPVLEKIGWIINDIAESFAEWIEQADKTGDLDSFMRNAAETLQQIYDIGKLVIGIIGEIIEILFPQSDKASDNFLTGVEKSLQKVKDWLGDPKNQQRIRDMFDKFEDFFDKLVNEWIPDLKQFGRDFGSLVRPIMNVVNWLGRVHNFLTVRIPNAVSSMAKKGGNVFDGVKNGFRAAINWIIGKWNSLSFSLPSVSFLGQQIGGGSIGTPHVDYLASGGISGSGRVVMNERGPEAVRLPQGSMVYSAGDSARMMGAGQKQAVDLNVKVDRTTERGVIDALLAVLRFEIENRYGGDVQRALGNARGA